MSLILHPPVWYFLLPVLGIKGYIISIFISEILNFLVSLIQLVIYSKVHINFIDWILIPSACSFVSFIYLKIFHFSFIDLKINLISNITLFIFIYVSLFLILNKLLVVKKSDHV